MIALQQSNWWTQLCSPVSIHSLRLQEEPRVEQDQSFDAADHAVGTLGKSLSHEHFRHDVRRSSEFFFDDHTPPSR